MILPKAPVERLIRNSGAQRVSDDASRELVEVLEKVGQKISEQAKKYSLHAGRKTITAEDIKLASQGLIDEI